jgi:hypothetical protein
MKSFFIAHHTKGTRRKTERRARDGTAPRRGSGECAVPPLEIGVQAVSLSPYHTGLAGPHRTRLPMPPAFLTCSCPLRLSPSGKSMTQESPFELLLTVSRMQHRVPRRTVFPHPVPRLHSHPCRVKPCLLEPAGRLAHTGPVRHVRDEFPFRATCFRRVLPHVMGFPHRRVLRSIRLPTRIRRAFLLPVLLRLPDTLVHRGA